MKRLFIIGAGGHGKVVADIAENMQCYDEIFFLDDARAPGEICGSFEVWGSIPDGMQHIPESDFFVAIGNASVRKKITEDLERAGANIPILIHPKAVIARDCLIGNGCDGRNSHQQRMPDRKRGDRKYSCIGGSR